MGVELGFISSILVVLHENGSNVIFTPNHPKCPLSHHLIFRFLPKILNLIINHFLLQIQEQPQILFPGERNRRGLPFSRI